MWKYIQYFLYICNYNIHKKDYENINKKNCYEQNRDRPKSD